MPHMNAAADAAHASAEGASYLAEAGAGCCIPYLGADCSPPSLRPVQPFGPVLPIVRVKNVEQAIEHVNANRLALQVSSRTPSTCLGPRSAPQCQHAGRWAWRLCLLGPRPGRQSKTAPAMRGHAAGLPQQPGAQPRHGLLEARTVVTCLSHFNGYSFTGSSCLHLQGCVFTRDVNKAIQISDAMETGSVQVTVLEF